MASGQEGGEALLHHFVDQAPFPIAMFDREMRYLMHSHKWLSVYGLGAVDIVGKSHFEVFPDLQEEWRFIFDHCLEGQTASCDAEQFQRPDGQEQWLRWKIVPWTDQDDAVGGLLMYCEDITASVAYRREIMAAQARYERLYLDTPALLFALDPKGRLVAASKTFLERLGARREEIIHRRLTERIVFSDGQQNADDLLERLRTEPEILDLPLTVSAAEGEEREVLLSTSHELGPDGELERITCVLTDITERSRAEQALQARTRELVRSNSELEQFAYAASHDLQQPLRAILGYGQLLERRHLDGLNDDARQAVERMVARAKQMQQLISDLLAYSRLSSQPSIPEALEVSHLVEIAEDNLAAAIEESGARVESGELPPVHGHRVPLIQLFQNLIGNAIKYRREATPLVRVTAEPAGAGFVEFTIADNGMGFDPRFAERVFGVFQRLHPPHKFSGSGIGLAIVKKVVEMHGGRIRAESTPGVGSRFIFTLPAAYGVVFIDDVEDFATNG